MHKPTTGARLIIVCGLPGSGKTRLATALERQLGAIRLCPDEWLAALSLSIYDEPMRARIERLQWKLTRELLPLGLTVIIEWGTWTKTDRDELRLGARELGAAVELHYLSASAEVLYERIQRRGRENPPINPESFSQWFDSFEAPTDEELALFDPPTPVA
jgi:predicted kinase